MSTIALFGGTFNPFHIGHYQMLDVLCRVDWIDKVFIMPDRLPPHKECDFLASDQDRISMCRIICEDFPKSELCLIEFERDGRSYSVDTMKFLKKRYPQDDFYFVCGGDMIASLDTWRCFDELINLTKFIAFNRKNSECFLSDVQKMRSKGADITVIYEDITDISSSELRKSLNSDMLPEKIYKYIMLRNLYNE